MKKIYLALTVLGFVAPNTWVMKVSIQTGNILLWARPLETMAGMFVNDISTAFVVDLLFVVLVFMIWSYQESKRLGMKAPWIVWVLTMLFGLAGGLPLFLYQRESALESNSGTNG